MTSRRDNQERFEAELPSLLRQKPGAPSSVYVPPVHRSATSRHVLATTWVEGERLDRAPAETIRRLIPVGVRCFLVQLLEMGFFHSDPHPGNMLVTPDGRLALIDVRRHVYRHVRRHVRIFRLGVQKVGVLFWEFSDWVSLLLGRTVLRAADVPPNKGA